MNQSGNLLKNILLQKSPNILRSSQFGKLNVLPNSSKVLIRFYSPQRKSL